MFLFLGVDLGFTGLSCTTSFLFLVHLTLKIIELGLHSALSLSCCKWRLSRFSAVFRADATSVLCCSSWAWWEAWDLFRAILASSFCLRKAPSILRSFFCSFWSWAFSNTRTCSSCSALLSEVCCSRSAWVVHSVSERVLSCDLRSSFSALVLSSLTWRSLLMDVCCLRSWSFFHSDSRSTVSCDFISSISPEEWTWHEHQPAVLSGRESPSPSALSHGSTFYLLGANWVLKPASPRRSPSWLSH